MTEIVRQNRCPACDSPDVISTVRRKNLVAMQNYVYRTYDDAMRSPVGDFDLKACINCGLAFNCAFDANLLTYDQNYDNDVPSAFYKRYSEDLANFLYKSYELSNGLIVDIGGGNGNFLKILCEMFPYVRGLGIDPSFQEVASDAGLAGQLSFIKDYFKEEHMVDNPALVICRHTLEHLDDPRAFLQSIHSTLVSFPRTPLFVETPDLNWTTQHGAYWNFCYEYHSYFTPESLANFLEIAGFRIEEVHVQFGGQYLWARATNDVRPPKKLKKAFAADSLRQYAESESSMIEIAKARFQEMKQGGQVLVVWGLSSKGVIFCNTIDPHRKLIDYCLDVNPNKQGAYVAGTGHEISSPGALSQIPPDSRVAIVIMNTNYADEIVEASRRLCPEAKFYTANGEKYFNGL